MPNFIIKDVKKQTPIQNLDEQINEMTVVRREDLQAAHWELYMHGASGVIIKVDLMKDGYRVLYDAAVMVGNAGTSERLTFKKPRTLGKIIRVVKEIGLDKGDWTGTDDYNCQDFVIAFMRGIKMDDSQIFKYELRRVATKHYPPSITEGMRGQIPTTNF